MENLLIIPEVGANASETRKILNLYLFQIKW